MDKKINHERILIAIALILCAGIMCYNFFFIPTVLPPTVIHTDKSIPSEKQPPQSSDDDKPSSTEVSSIQQSQLLNINTASAEELADTLPRVGKVLADKIIAYRNSNGNFKKIEDLKNVKGIGNKNFENMQDLICV